MKTTRPTVTQRTHSRRAANHLLLLCLFNIGPVMLLAAMGLVGAAAVHPERSFHTGRAIVTGMIVLGLPLVISQGFVRRGRVGGVTTGLIVVFLFLTGSVYLIASVIGSSLELAFKLLAGSLTVVAIGAYGVGLVRLFQANRELRQEQAGQQPRGHS